jgi:hypothetical protein
MVVALQELGGKIQIFGGDKIEELLYLPPSSAALGYPVIPEPGSTLAGMFYVRSTKYCGGRLLSY